MFGTLNSSPLPGAGGERLVTRSRRAGGNRPYVNSKAPGGRGWAVSALSWPFRVRSGLPASRPLSRPRRDAMRACSAAVGFPGNLGPFDSHVAQQARPCAPDVARLASGPPRATLTGAPCPQEAKGLVKEFEKAANFQGRPPQAVANRKKELVSKLNTLVMLNRDLKKNVQQRKELMGELTCASRGRGAAGCRRYVRLMHECLFVTTQRPRSPARATRGTAEAAGVSGAGLAGGKRSSSWTWRTPRLWRGRTTSS